MLERNLAHGALKRKIVLKHQVELSKFCGEQWQKVSDDVKKAYKVGAVGNHFWICASAFTT